MHQVIETDPPQLARHCSKLVTPSCGHPSRPHKKQLQRMKQWSKINGVANPGKDATQAEADDFINEQYECFRAGMVGGGGSKTTKSMAPPFDDNAAKPGDACNTGWQPYNCTLFQHGDDLDCDFTSEAGYDLGCCGCASLGGCMPDNGQGCDCC